MIDLNKFLPKPPQPPAPPPGLGRRARKAPAVEKQPIRRFGSKFLRLFADPIQGNDWCTPWPGFVGAHTSLSEQMIYQALARITGDPPNPKEPPYAGGVTWTFQDPLLGGRLSRGGQVCDFLVQWGTDEVCLRLQSERWHVYAENAKKADEAFEKAHSTAIIRDIYEQSFVGDCSGEAACRVVANALAGREDLSPEVSRGAKRVRR